MKSTAKTTIEFKGESYPFYRTIRGQWDYENAGFSLSDMASGKVSALYAYVFFQLRDCAKRAGRAINISLNEFIDTADGEDLLSVFGRLRELEESLKNKEEGEKPGKQIVQPEPENRETN